LLRWLILLTQIIISFVRFSKLVLSKIRPGHSILVSTGQIRNMFLVQILQKSRNEDF